MPKSVHPYDAVIAYVPVIHRGYLAFFAHFSTVKSAYVLNAKLLSEIDYLRKELRAIKPDEVALCLNVLPDLPPIQVVDQSKLKELDRKTIRIVMPDEDVSRYISGRYLSQASVDFYPVFLRWDRQAVESGISSDNISETIDATDIANMESAYIEASRSSDIWRRVGVVITKGGKPIIKGVNQSLSTQNTPWAEGDPRIVFHQGEGIEMSTFMHAEAVVIAKAAATGTSLKNCSIYVTTFPCPPCAMLIARSGIKRCIYAEGYAVLDGLRVLSEAGVKLSRVRLEHPPVLSGLVPYPGKNKNK